MPQDRMLRNLHVRLLHGRDKCPSFRGFRIGTCVPKQNAAQFSAGLPGVISSFPLRKDTREGQR